MARVRDPATATRLLAAAARVLADEGRDAVTARRLAAEIGASTMAVYTHFGSMDTLLADLYRDAFARFGAALVDIPRSDDPVADWMAQGWRYRQFALANRHLYRVMFTEGLSALAPPPPGEQGSDDAALATSTFVSLLDCIERNVAARRWTLDDEGPELRDAVARAGHVVWATSHGHMSIELTGYFEAGAADPVQVFAESMVRLSIAFGDAPADARRSLARVQPFAVHA